MFNFEEIFSKTIQETQVDGYRIFYSNPFTETVECYINEKYEIFDLEHNLVEDQDRYREMIESSALVEAKKLEMSKPLLSELNYI